MPEDSINEDTFMGYVICSEGLEIEPLYSMEKAESVSRKSAANSGKNIMQEIPYEHVEQRF